MIMQILIINYSPEIRKGYYLHFTDREKKKKDWMFFSRGHLGCDMHRAPEYPGCS